MTVNDTLSNPLSNEPIANDPESQQGITLSWKDLSYSVEEGTSKKDLLTRLSGTVKPGEMLAVMGPSGAGKSSFLDALAGKLSVSGEVLLNGINKSPKQFSTYVHQDDALIGCLTVRETLNYAAKFKLPSSTPADALKKRVDEVILEFGLSRVQNSKIGNAIIRGVSGGEKRRVTLACQLMTYPRVIFLDEPTSGLDSAAAYNVLESLRKVCRQRSLTVIATIHQPSSESYALFDNLLLLGQGHTLYCGKRENAENYFSGIGYALPRAMNPADYYLSLINNDFLVDRDEASKRVAHFIQQWETSPLSSSLNTSLANESAKSSSNLLDMQIAKNSLFHQTMVLISRNFTTAYKNVVAYWIRVAMYVALGILMGTTWFKMGTDQRSIEDRFSVHFFSVAFLCFMSVAGIPAFLEDRLTFIRERADNLYSSGPYVIANTVISVPFIFLISLSFSVVSYFLIELKAGVEPFFIFVGYLFLALMVAESICVFISALIPIFVAALAIVAFLNGFFMVVQGYFVQRQNLPIGWIWAHWIDYQKFAFEGIIHSDFGGQEFQCESKQVNGTESCHCIIQSPHLPDGSCFFYGTDILEDREYTGISPWGWAGALIGMVVLYRLGFYLALVFRKC